MQTFSFNPPINLIGEGKWLLAVTSFECINSVFNITNENISFSISTRGHWNSEDGEDLIYKLNKLLELRSENDKELHVEEVQKKRNQIRIRENDYLRLSDLDRYKHSIIRELKRVKYKDLEDMVYRLQLTYDEIVDILVVKNIPRSTKRYTLVPGFFMKSVINL